MNVILHKNNKDQSPATRQRNSALLLTAAGAAVLAAIPLHASAEEIDAPAVLLADVAPVSDAELDQNRGGMVVGGINFSLSINVGISIQGPTINPISVKTNYSVDTPGTLTNLGTQINNTVNGALQQAGLGSAPAPDNKGSSTPATQTIGNVAVTNVPSGGSDSSSSGAGGAGSSGGASGTGDTGGSSSANAGSNSSSANTEVADNSQPPAPDNGKPNFSVQSNPQSNSVNISNDAGTNVNLSTANGILTTVSNQANDVTVQTQVDFNYAVNNYRQVVQNAQAFQQAMNLAQQMLAMRGIAGH